MPKPTKGPRLGGSPAHQRLMLANLATSLFEHGRIKTTETKAKRLRPMAERLITKAKRGDLHNRRLVLRVIRDKSVVHTLFTEIAPTFADREGGYTRITKVGPRKGDNAPMALIELVTESVEESKKANAKTVRPARKPAGGKPVKAVEPVAKASKSAAKAPVEATELDAEELAAAAAEADPESNEPSDVSTDSATDLTEADSIQAEEPTVPTEANEPEEPTTSPQG